LDPIAIIVMRQREKRNKTKLNEERGDKGDERRRKER
jgi:hypothetical protein